jgi:hypothetical protein
MVTAPLNHTHTPWDPSWRVIGSSQRLVPSDCKQTHKINASSGCRTRDPSKLVAADLRLRQHGHQNQMCVCVRAYIHTLTYLRVTLKYLSFHLSTSFVSAFSKLRRATVSLVMSIRLSVCLCVCMQQFGSHWTDMDKIWYFRLFLKSVEKIKSFM